MAAVAPVEVPVIVVGSVNIDLVAAGGRMPRPGETVSMERFAEVQGGKGGNQASAAAALGAPVHLIGAVGSDHWGEAARADLAARGIDVGALATVDGSTGVAIILVDDGGENSIAIVPGANAAVSPAAVEAALAASTRTTRCWSPASRSRWSRSSPPLARPRLADGASC